MDYYSQKLFLAKVDKENNFVGKVERWLAHEKAILHRGFTVILTFQNKVVLQHRKHPAFDGFFDLSFSSHPVYIQNELQPMETAILNTLEREWNLSKQNLQTELRFLDKFYYYAKDPKSVYIEHEIDYVYEAKLNKLPAINHDFAYGYETIDVLNIASQISKFQLAPWVKKILTNKVIRQHLEAV